MNYRLFKQRQLSEESQENESYCPLACDAVLKNSVSLNVPSLSCVQFITFVFYFNEVDTLNTDILSRNSHPQLLR